MTIRSGPPAPRSFEFRLRVGLALMLVPMSIASLLLLIGLLTVSSEQDKVRSEVADELQTISSLRDDVGGASRLVGREQSSPDRSVEPALRALADRVSVNLLVARGFDEAEEVRLSRDATRAWRSGLATAYESFDANAQDRAMGRAAALRQFGVVASDLAQLDAYSRSNIQAELEASTALGRRLVVVAIVIGVAAGIGNMLLIRRLLAAAFGPLRQLTEGVARFDVEDLGRRLTVGGDREFQAVGRAFNGMADRLQHTLRSLEHQAFHDALTGLPNRANFIRRLNGSGPAGRAFLMFDLDGFKAINDGLGHAAGDDALVQIGRRIERTLRPGDLVARLGGDEFAVILDNETSVEDVEDIALRVIVCISEPLEIAGRSVVLHASGGIAQAEPGDDPAEVFRRADVALYVAKDEGKGRVRRFHPAMLAEVERKLALDTDLRVAVERGEIEVHYQPTVCIATGRVAGVEALARWRHPREGLISPVSFIPAAEASGYIVPLGRHILEAACSQVKTWQQRPGLDHLGVSVNVSGRQLHGPAIVEQVCEVLERSQLAPACLTLEVTETVMADPDAVARVHDLKALGVRIALDDFGTGYSSLSYLQQLPIDVLKIDKAFIDNLGSRADHAVFASAIIRMGRSLNLETVAEGVETSDQLRVLASVGCDLVQGHLFAAAGPPSEIEPRLLELASTSPGHSPARVKSVRVPVRIGPLPAEAAREWLRHAHWAIDQLERGALLSGGVPSPVLAIMRDYVHRWTVSAMESDYFYWASDEDAQVLAVLMRHWQPVSAALAEAHDAGTVSLSEQAGAFSEELVHALLIALADADHYDIEAASLAHIWPSHDAPTPPTRRTTGR